MLWDVYFNQYIYMTVYYTATIAYINRVHQNAGRYILRYNDIFTWPYSHDDGR